jgi:RsiW-degrading membrane proteinase PrsW (M82 family)
MPIWLGLVLFFVGGVIGFFVAALMASASLADDESLLP